MKIGAQGTLASGVQRVLILGVMAAGAIALIFGCERSAKRASLNLPPTPETDPLAQPKSLQQVGVPVEMTRAAIPADNPQTAEKISLGQKLFFDRVCRLTARSHVAHAMIPHSPLPTGNPPRSASKAASASATHPPF